MSHKYIILTGDLQRGFVAHGPYESISTTTSDNDILVEDAVEGFVNYLQAVDATQSVHVVALHPAVANAYKEKLGYFNE